jgi:hypothetical protein
MSFCISRLQPAPADYDVFEGEEQYDLEGDTQMAGADTRAISRLLRRVVTPGEVVTDDQQWMR